MNKMILRNWTIKRINNDVIIYGNIYNDIHHRFSDGAFIHTSRVLQLDLENKKVITKNNTYYLE